VPDEDHPPCLAVELLCTIDCHSGFSQTCLDAVMRGVCPSKVPFTSLKCGLANGVLRSSASYPLSLQRQCVRSPDGGCNRSRTCSLGRRVLHLRQLVRAISSLGPHPPPRTIWVARTGLAIPRRGFEPSFRNIGIPRSDAGSSVACSMHFCWAW